MKRVGLLVALALLIRIPGLFTDFWLDEIWSYNITSQIHSLMDLFFSEAGRIDNNHPLNTLLMRVIGMSAPVWMYRVPALVAGVGCVLIIARRDKLAAILIATCFPFVFYSSEARGYMSAVFFALLAFEALLQCRERFSVAAALVFNLACVLGVLSHLTFVHFYLAALCWSVFVVRRSGLKWFALNVFPIAFVAALYHFFVKHLVIGGAPDRNPVTILISVWSMLLGGPEANDWIGYVFAACAIALFGASVVRTARRRDDRWLFDVLVVIVAPCFLLVYDLILSVRPQPLMVRYFLVAMVFALIAIAREIEKLPRKALIAAVVAFVAANSIQLLDFARVGRGGYERAMDRIIAQSAPGSVVPFVTGDSDFRVREIVRFYNARRSPLRRLTYISHPTRWMIVSSPTTSIDPSYELDSVYPAHSLSGTNWRLYRRR